MVGAADGAAEEDPSPPSPSPTPVTNATRSLWRIHETGVLVWWLRMSRTGSMQPTGSLGSAWKGFTWGSVRGSTGDDAEAAEAGAEADADAADAELELVAPRPASCPCCGGTLRTCGNPLEEKAECAQRKASHVKTAGGKRAGWAAESAGKKTEKTRRSHERRCSAPWARLVPARSADLSSVDHQSGSS
jgi:hypothetical protein